MVPYIRTLEYSIQFNVVFTIEKDFTHPYISSLYMCVCILALTNYLSFPLMAVQDDICGFAVYSYFYKLVM